MIFLCRVEKLRIMKRFCIKSKASFVLNKRGSQIVEASIVMPVVISVIVLLLKVFVFYLEIMSASVQVHEEAISIWEESDSSVIEVYEDSTSVSLLPWGLLQDSLSKTINVKMYLVDEDVFVRAKRLADAEI